MKRLAASVAVACLFASPLCAQTYFYSGAIGKAPVFASLSRSGDNLIGWYLYTKYGKQIELQGKIDTSGTFHLDESSFDTTKKSGSFAGFVKQMLWSGTWQSAAGGAPLAFVLKENHDTLANLNGDFRCSEKHVDRKHGYVYNRSTHVSVSKGIVTRADLAQESKGPEGDSQGCYIGLKDFRQVPSETGILLRAKSDNPNDKTDGTQHCTVRIIGSADFLYVSPGDLSQNGNDCKGAGEDIMFCSPRASWGDYMIERKSAVCKPAD
jgi:hypothetical protein